MKDRQERLHQRTARALERLAEAREAVEARRGSPPRPGDLFVSPATAEHDVQWAVVDRDYGSPGRLRLVAADLNPLVGSADVAIPPHSPCGTLAVRCHVDVTLGANALDPDLRTGVLADDDLKRIDEKRRRLDRGPVRGSALERETDVETEYQDRIDELAEAAVELWMADPQPELVPLVGEHDPEALSLSAAEAAERARTSVLSRDLTLLITSVVAARKSAHLGPESFDLKDPRQAGWGVVFSADEPQEVRDALAPLVEHRRAELGEDRVRILEHRPGEDWKEWLARHDVGAGEPVRPAKVPYYLLLIGPPTRIPYELQSVLGLQRAVGRLSFDEPEEYRRYALSVVAQETSPRAPQAKKAVFFAPRYRRDPVSRLHADLLVKPLVESGVAQKAGFAAVHLWGEEATKERLSAVFQGNGKAPPAVFFGAAHGLGWPEGHPEQAAAQGAVLCQDWPGLGEPIDRGHYFSADDLGDDARVHGTIAFLVTSYGAGTPRDDVFLQAPGEEAPRIAEESFVARLPQRMLGHAGGGALAVVGLIDRVWGHGLAATAEEERLRPFRNTLSGVLEGAPVGHAVQELNQRYATLAFDLNKLLEEIGFGRQVDDREVATVWVERNHAQSYVVLGDPAVRLRVEAMG